MGPRRHGPLSDRAYPNMIEEVRLAPDSPLEGGVSCELVSEMPNSPASWENTENFADSRLGGAWETAKKCTKSVSYGPIPCAS